VFDKRWIPADHYVFNATVAALVRIPANDKMKLYLEPLGRPACGRPVRCHLIPGATEDVGRIFAKCHASRLQNTDLAWAPTRVDRVLK